jgi:DNA-binding phage protein
MVRQKEHDNGKDSTIRRYLAEAVESEDPAAIAVALAAVDRAQHRNKTVKK